MTKFSIVRNGQTIATDILTMELAFMFAHTLNDTIAGTVTVRTGDDVYAI